MKRLEAVTELVTPLEPERLLEQSWPEQVVEELPLERREFQKEVATCSKCPESPEPLPTERDK